LDDWRINFVDVNIDILSAHGIIHERQLISALPKQNKYSGRAMFIHKHSEHVEFREILCSYGDECEDCPLLRSDAVKSCR
jgi:hypothetical protein